MKAAVASRLDSRFANTVILIPLAVAIVPLLLYVVSKLAM